MTLPLDLNSLDSDETFEQLCFRLTRREYPDAIPIAHGSWDGGRDIVRLGRRGGDIVWQCKMTRQNIARIKPKVRESLDALDKMKPIHKWILCVSVDVSGNFLDWLRNTLLSFPFISQWEIWGRTEILRRLENSPDIVEVFFYPIWKSFEQRFRTDDIELVEFEMEHGIGWTSHTKALLFGQSVGRSSDFVLDITVRNRGTISALINRMRLEVNEVRPVLRGLPGEGLLWPQAVYQISLKGGKPDPHPVKLEPPLEVDAGKHARFHVRLTDAGYAWTGFVRVVLGYSGTKELHLPWIHLSA